MKLIFRSAFLFSFFCLSARLTFGQEIDVPEKQVQYISGTDNINTLSWEFFCTAGRNSGEWSTIEVPSCWEQQGFGIYNYGRDYHTYGKGFRYADESGQYKTEFEIPSEWKNKRIYLVFDGSMTDTEVKINGVSTGETHQGAFYRFRYDISDKVLLNQTNALEVTVHKMSSDNSVNAAERRADYWIFGGIYRPVYLEAFPEEFIDRIALDASADGSFSADVYLKGLRSERSLSIDITDTKGKLIAKKSIDIKSPAVKVNLKLQVEKPLLWTAETPNLYRVNLSLSDGKKLIYHSSEKFGFRTIEVKEGDGIYINGTKVKMKGINRHAFWPETGRSLNSSINLMDVKLIREMNMNAVRCSHYPPDKEFLDFCDSLGLYVIDELAGWQNAYNTTVGEKLVREMVTRDANHPSIIFWSNGNEGGHNMELVDDYGLYDHSNRPVIHAHHRPGNVLNGIDCNHYEEYNSTHDILADTSIYMVTEFLHCQNDGGGGAGLNDYWSLMRNSERSGGGFLWALLDEGLVRTDRNNIVDVNGVNAPDGVLGPHREKEGSFYSIREIFSPIYISMETIPSSFDGAIELENRFDFINMNTNSFSWKLVRFMQSGNFNAGYKSFEEGEVKGPNIAAGTRGKLILPLPEKFAMYDALILEANDPSGNQIMNWTWPITGKQKIVEQLRAGTELGSAHVEESDSTLSVSVNGISILLSKLDGSLLMARNERNRFKNFGNGPRLVAGETEFQGLEHYSDDDGYVVEVSYTDDLKYARWKLCNDGWVELEYEYSLTGEFEFSGVSFDFPEDHVISAKWLGNGPYRVWKNRMQGGTINVWENAYNNTQTGYSPWIYPEFKGYYSNITWMELNTVEGKFIVATDTDDMFIRLFEFYSLPGIESHPVLPGGDISFLEHIPPTGTKMSTNNNHYPAVLGPESQLNSLDGNYKRKLYFYFGTIQTE